MKKLISIFCFILFSNLSFGQIMARKAGNYYEYDKLWERDSISVKQLMNNYKLDISKLEYVKFFGDFDLSKELHDNYSYTNYVHMLDKKTGTVSISSIPHEQKLPAPNKYVMVYCFDDFTEKKIINIKVF
jgi:hypothetical protein